HLPKHEIIYDVSFVVLRVYNNECGPEADTVQELTRKIAIFYSEKFVMTIHRHDEYLTKALREKWTKRSADPTVTPERILGDILFEVVRTYSEPVMECMNNLETFEMEIFGAG